MNIHERLAALGVAVPDVLLPGPLTALEKWAVIACDQFTQDRAFWSQAEQAVGTAPSALRLIFPEVYLEDGGRPERIAAIHRAMKNYLADGVFAPPRRCCVYIERATPCHPLRRGLVIAVDLERYDWSPGAKPLIRATEGTVRERIPPRMEIRRDAPLESPHILLLIDDETDSLLPALGRRAQAPLYKTDLSPNAGSVSGWALDAEADWELLACGLEDLARRAERRYGESGGEPFLFAMGDGNHSLATAKAVWEEYKTAHAGEQGLENHPARWALVELENLYDPGIAFEPIHRIVFGVGLDEILEVLSALPGFSAVPIGVPPVGDTQRAAHGDTGGDSTELSRMVGDAQAAKNRLGLIAGTTAILVESDAPGLATGYLQPLLDAFVRKRQDRRNGGVQTAIDYIHGEEELFRLAAADGAVSPDGSGPAVGILLPPIRKGGLFETVARSGALPRKSFSMGGACEKRFYLECRKLFG
ncbi:hypothetical protein AGMMS50267_13370 [Spirochaetia bacterium]|nr:hypothetical protein AGMMS50267_13370 [Spirochaetia bacterium]